jgi:hypothetical protein
MEVATIQEELSERSNSEFSHGYLIGEEKTPKQL